MVLSHRKALIQRRKCSPPMTKNRLLGPSEIRALEFKGEFRRFRFRSVPATIDNDQSISQNPRKQCAIGLAKKDRQPDQPGSPSVLGISSKRSSHCARLAKQICAFGRMSIALSRLPAGTTSKAPLNWTLGRADPHSMQKLFSCRVAGTR
jgi:hypothetical protein